MARLRTRRWRRRGRTSIMVAGRRAGARAGGLQLAEQLRDAHPRTARFELNVGGGNFKAQFRRADRSGQQVALIMGEDEMQRGIVAVKPLRREAGRWSARNSELAVRIGKWVSGSMDLHREWSEGWTNI